MLVLTRRSGEHVSLSITAQQLAALAQSGEPLNVLVHLRSSRVASKIIVGVDAPPQVRVLRGELRRLSLAKTGAECAVS